MELQAGSHRQGKPSPLWMVEGQSKHPGLTTIDRLVALECCKQSHFDAIYTCIDAAITSPFLHKAPCCSLFVRPRLEGSGKIIAMFLFPSGHKCTANLLKMP
jgi:hypothetical protein